MVHAVQFGKNTRMSFSRIEEILEIPNLIEIQKNSYKNFREEGLKEVFHDISPITNYSGNLILEFIDYVIEDKTNYTIEECKERDTTYASPLNVKVRLINKETGEIKEQKLFMGEFPLMTDNGTFIINGAERVIVSQLVRSPGVYFEKEYDKIKGKNTTASTMIPNRGAWLEFEIDINDVMYVRIDRTRKIAVTVLLRALGFGTNEDIINLLSDDERIINTLEKDNSKNTDEALIEIYKKLRPGEPPTVETARSLLNGLFFDPKRYDLGRFGRYKFNKKLSLATRIEGKVAAEDIIDPQTGEIMVTEGETITDEKAVIIQNAGINAVTVVTKYKPVKIIGNNTVDMSNYVNFDVKALGINERVNYQVLKDILDISENEDKLKKLIEERASELVPKHVTMEDIVSSINYILNLYYDLGDTDDIDHLGNRRIRSVGELLQNQFRIGLSRMERVVRERMTIQDMDIVTPQALINTRPVVAAIKEFFGSSQLSQFMDQTNPLAELANKRRLSALGPGGLNRERATFEVRDVHYSHYGRMCPIETPEGPNIGLIGSLSTYARINEYGFIEAPYRKFDRETGKVTDTIHYLTADEEDKYVIAQANEKLDEEGRFINRKVVCRFKDEFIETERNRVDYMDVSPKQVVSVAAAMIPFLENDDASRALMGSNMQRQAVPLIKADSPIVATGIEYKAAIDSGAVVLAKNKGVIDDVTAKYITVKRSNGVKDRYNLLKYLRSNQGTCINQRPTVKQGDKVEVGDVIADGPSTDKGEIALGKNILMGFMTWEGYNYEDAILISEKLVKEDIFTSIHIEEYECEARDTKLGPEEITAEIPNVGDEALKDLDEKGVIRTGAEVHAGDILVGKVTPKGETELTAEERLLRAIFGEKARDVRDTSLRVPHGESGIIVDVKEFTREDDDELSPGVNRMVRVYIAQKRKLSVGDKMAGRHGNKGVISRILPEEDMPFLPDGTPLEIVMNPLGVPSRMNIGQVLEVHLGYAAKALGWKIATPVFDGATEDDIAETLGKAGLSLDGKSILYDGRTGEPFDNRVTVGYMYILKLAHLVDDKIHARSTGPYSLVTQQPLGGKAQFGGQRFGEMEVWALEAYGAAYTLQEILTIKSDDTIGRVKTYEAIVKGENVPEPGIPESFKVLVKELQSLALDVRIFSEDNIEIPLRETEEEYIKNPEKFRVKEDVHNPDFENMNVDAVGLNQDVFESEFEIPDEIGEVVEPLEDIDDNLDDSILEDYIKNSEMDGDDGLI
ncbi:MAG: DNA-directed RNA polymerase subunit beta [Clostridiales bacterium]|jgi:DNA-directed RNA polymerase subunit beta|nr:DNA-directed RNA polymerase subunit beta [Clostridiales bacterium]